MSSFLPTEIVSDILSRLPLKPLVSFRCVSKPWCSLIDSPYFAKMHLNQSMKSKSNHNLILGFEKKFFHSIELRSLDSPGIDSIDSTQCLQPPVSGYHMSTSCNGLIHMFMQKSDCTLHYIWNPFTRKYWELPAVSFDPCVVPAGINLWMVEKHLRRTHTHGFAYVSETDEYKVVQVTEFWRPNYLYVCNQVSIFSSRSNEWERLEPFPYQIQDTRALDAYLNGNLHIVVEKGSPEWWWGLMVFDTRTKQYSMFPKPDFARMMDNARVAVLEGSLCLLDTGNFDWMDIWVMKDYGVEASWFKLLSVELDSASLIVFGFHPLIMTYSEDGAKVLLTENGKTLTWYNLSGARVREVTVNVLPSNFFAEVWSESLLSFPGFISVDDGK